VIARFAGRGHVRILLGLAVSACFIGVTVSRVDLDAVAAALTQVDPLGLALAPILVGIEVALRTLRWQQLLRPTRPVPFRSALSYTCIGYFANSLLPARLGDLARAYLAGGAFGIERVAVIGTILVERLADGGFILVVVAVAGIVVVGGGSFSTTALGLGVVAAVGSVALAGLVVALRRTRIQRTRIGAVVADLGARLAAGTIALRSARGAITVAALTVVAFGVAVVAFAVVARSLGVALSPAQVILAMGAVALSTAIPAAPGSLGTYEFVGVAVLTSFGISPELALAAILLVHLVATLPPALAGLLVAWHLHFRIGTIADGSSGARRAIDPIAVDTTRAA
jgi:glycosyltransferase 2 family protein